MLFKGSTAYAAIEHEYQKVRSTRENHKLVQSVADNFDCSISTRNGSKQTHSMAVIMAQEHISTDMAIRKMIICVVN